MHVKGSLHFSLHLFFSLSFEFYLPIFFDCLFVNVYPSWMSGYWCLQPEGVFFTWNFTCNLASWLELLFSRIRNSITVWKKECREWHVLKAAHKAIYSHDWPRNLQLEQVRHARNLRSSSTINLVIPYASDTFQYSAAALFNSLPSNVKCCDNFKSFSKQTLCILRECCRNRAGWFLA